MSKDTPEQGRKVYVASSWRNEHYQQAACGLLLTHGHRVYDFRHPRAGDNGFHWSEIDPGWKSWTVAQYRDALLHPLAEAGFQSDKEALDWADTGVIVMPCGRSAHLELGYLSGQGKPCIVFALEPMEPELMVKLASGGVAGRPEELIQWINALPQGEAGS
jgi:hypothetical protein